MSQAPNAGVVHALLLDSFFQNFLFGVIVTQAFQYWNDCRDDPRPKRIFVATVVFLSALQTGLEDYKIWGSIALKRRWPTSPLQWSDFFLNGVICSLCQAFYIGRCWLMTEKRRWVLCLFLALLVVTITANIHLAVVIGIAFNASSATNDLLNVSRNLLPSTITAFTLWMSGTLALDVCITVTLMVVLWRSRTGALQSDRVVYHIINITWESAAVPSICTIIAAALYRAVPYTYDHAVILLVLQTGKLYTLGMLRSLNLREKLRQKLRSVDLGGRTSLRSWNWDTPSLVCTSTTRNSLTFPETLEPCEGQMGIPDTLVRWSCHHLLDVTEERLPTESEIRINTSYPTSEESTLPRNRVNSGRSSDV